MYVCAWLFFIALQDDCQRSMFYRNVNIKVWLI